MHLVDFLTQAERGERMSLIRAKDTKPEMVVRRLAYAMGYRFRLHRRDLSGSPDLVFSGRRKVVLVHGCFWHDHECRVGKRDRVSPGYWSTKLAANAERNQRVEAALSDAGWECLVLWECRLRDQGKAASKLLAFLGPPDGARRARRATL